MLIKTTAGKERLYFVEEKTIHPSKPKKTEEEVGTILIHKINEVLQANEGFEFDQFIKHRKNADSSITFFIGFKKKKSLIISL